MAKQSKGAKAAAAQVAEGNNVANTSLHDLAVVAMKAADAASKAQGTAKAGKEGAAIVALRMFQTGATEAALREAFTSVEAEARSGQIEGVKLEPAKRKGKDGGVSYLIPGSFMNAKSITCKGASYNLPRNVESFGKLRELVNEESARRALAEANDQQKAYSWLVERVKQISDTIKESKDYDLATLRRMGSALALAMLQLAELSEGASTIEVTTTAAAANALAEAA